MRGPSLFGGRNISAIRYESFRNYRFHATLHSVTQDTIKAPGRPQDDELTEKILCETVRVLQESGYAGLRIEQVAAAIGCGKTTIYRRWPTKAELTAAAITFHVKLGEIPDTGSLVEDLIELAWQNAENHVPKPWAKAAPHALWAVLVVPEVREIFGQGFLADRRTMWLFALQRGIEQKQLSVGADLNAIIDLIAGFATQRTLILNVAMRKSDFKPIVEALVANPPLQADAEL